MEQPVELVTGSAVVPAQPRLLDQVRGKIRINHYSRATEKTYVYWIRFFILHMGKRHPAQMGAREVSDFLPWLDDMVRAKRPVRLPTVMTEDEVCRLLAQLHGGAWLMAGCVSCTWST